MASCVHSALKNRMEEDNEKDQHLNFEKVAEKKTKGKEETTARLWNVAEDWYMRVQPMNAL
ncbi:hypothetical protein LguiA_017180 [Lonicera macranthoides]